MIRKLPFMLIALCFLLSCGGDDPLDIKPEDATAISSKATEILRIINE